MNRVYVCSCFGITETEVRAHADAGACTPRRIASVSKAGTDCGSCVRRIQSILGRGAGCPRRELLGEPAEVPAALTGATSAVAPADEVLAEAA
ncbi:(2Fe-2S)-binding protein [Streptomyces odonnellii]|uniref:(2Fe-2S)-binding protein n=1 Tax=Streptomyces odonnellii TaxID=1417980 RepID=UPI000626BEA3|nr:(2Fe-2S)-binding protein [Streptomyces odonnellii]